MTPQIFRIRQKNIQTTLVFLMIFLSFGWIPDAASTWLKACGFTLIILLAMIQIKLADTKILKNKKIIAIIILTASLLAISATHNRSEDLNLAIKIALALLLVSIIPIDAFLKTAICISKILVIPTILGLACSSFGINTPIPASLLADEKTYYITPFLTVQRQEFETRAYSIFWEPGVLSCFANLIIATKVFRYNKTLGSCLPEIIHIALSQSAGGILSFLFLLAAKTLSKNKKLDIAVLLTSLAFLAAFVIPDFNRFFTFSISIANHLTEPLLSRNLFIDASFAARGVDFYLPFNLALNSPLYGYAEITEFVTSSLYIRGQSADIITNSWGSLAYYYGFVFALLYASISFTAIYKLSNKKSYTLSAWYYLLLSASPTYTTLTILYLIFSLTLSPSRKSEGRPHTSPSPHKNTPSFGRDYQVSMGSINPPPANQHAGLINLGHSGDQQRS